MATANPPTLHVLTDCCLNFAGSLGTFQVWHFEATNNSGTWLRVYGEIVLADSGGVVVGVIPATDDVILDPGQRGRLAFLYTGSESVSPNGEPRLWCHTKDDEPIVGGKFEWREPPKPSEAPTEEATTRSTVSALLQTYPDSRLSIEAAEEAVYKAHLTASQSTDGRAAYFTSQVDAAIRAAETVLYHDPRLSFDWLLTHYRQLSEMQADRYGDYLPPGSVTCACANSQRSILEGNRKRLWKAMKPYASEIVQSLEGAASDALLDHIRANCWNYDNAADLVDEAQRYLALHPSSDVCPFQHDADRFAAVEAAVAKETAEKAARVARRGWCGVSIAAGGVALLIGLPGLLNTVDNALPGLLRPSAKPAPAVPVAQVSPEPTPTQNVQETAWYKQWAASQKSAEPAPAAQLEEWDDPNHPSSEPPVAPAIEPSNQDRAGYLHRGSRGGCFTYSASGRKRYVDRSECTAAGI